MILWRTDGTNAKILLYGQPERFHGIRRCSLYVCICFEQKLRKIMFIPDGPSFNTTCISNWGSSASELITKVF